MFLRGTKNGGELLTMKKLSIFLDRGVEAVAPVVVPLVISTGLALGAYKGAQATSKFVANPPPRVVSAIVGLSDRGVGILSKVQPFFEKRGYLIRRADNGVVLVEAPKVAEPEAGMAH